MKIKVMPDISTRKSDEDIQAVYEPFYKGDERRADIIQNNCLYILSFLIPFLLLLSVMFLFQYAPFGNKSMFILDGSQINLSVLTQIIWQLRTGNFHFFTLYGTSGSEIFSTFAFYLSSPFTLITLLFNQKTALGLLSLFTVLRISLSGPIFLYYLTHRLNGKQASKYDYYTLIFSLGYALSSYALIQYNDFMYLDIFMLFPLFMLGFEELILNNRKKLYLIVLTYCLFSNFYLGITLTLFSYIFCIFINSDIVNNYIKRIFKVFLYNLFCMCLSAITVIPGLYGLYSHKLMGSKILETSFTSDFWSFLHQFLLLSPPSYASLDSAGSNVYIGTVLFILIGVSIAASENMKERIKKLIFIAIIIFTMLFSSAQYFFNCRTFLYGSFLNYAFVLVFFLLCMGYDGLTQIKTVKVRYIVICCLIPICLIIASMNLSGITPNFNSIQLSIDLLIGYSVLIVLYRLFSIRKEVFRLILILVSVMELCANGFAVCAGMSGEDVSLSQIILPKENAAYFGSLENGRTDILECDTYSDVNTGLLFSRFSANSIISGYDTSASTNPLADSLSGMRYLYVNKDSTKKINLQQFHKIANTELYDIYENKYSFPAAFIVGGTLSDSENYASQIDSLNKKASALGSKKDLFSENPLSIQVETSEPDTLMVTDMGHQIFGFSKHYSKEFDESPIPRSYKITYNFTPSDDGPCYLYTYSGIIFYYDHVNHSKEYTFTHYDPLANDSDHIESFRAFTFNDSEMMRLTKNAQSNSCIMTYDSLRTLTIPCDVADNSTVLTILPYNKNYKVTIDGKKTDYISFNDQLAIPVASGTHTIKIKCLFPAEYAGILLTIFTALSSICYKKKLKKGCKNE